MKKIFSFAGIVLGSLFFGASIAAAAAFIVPQGGTGQTALTSSQLLYGAGAGAVQSVGTTTLTATSPLSLSQPVVKVGGVNSVISLDTSGSWTGNAGTATALAANGSNCSSGQAPLGVDAAGAVESCFDVWTESENTAAAYAAQATTITVAGTAQQITSSAGAQSLASNRTWTLSLPSHVAFPGNFRATNSTTTNATTTALDVTGLLTFGGVTGNSWDDFCTAITGGSGLCDGTDSTGSGGTGLATSTTIADTWVIYGTSAADVGAEAAFTYDDATNKLVVENASTTAFSSGYASSTTAVAGTLTISSTLTIGGDTIDEFVGTGLTLSSGDLQTTLGTSVAVSELASADFGDFTCNGSACTIDSGVVAAADLATADFGDFSCNTGTCTVDADAVALATDTTGNYVATLSSSGSITVGNSGSENAAVTANLNMANANTWTALQTFTNSSTTLGSFNQFWAGQTATTSISAAGTITIGGNIVFAGDTIDELVGTGLQVSSGDLQTTLGTAIDSSEITDGTIAVGDIASADFGDFTCNGSACTVDANAIALSTDTTGNYLATLADDGQSTITVNNSGSEGAAVTLRVIDVVCTDCLTTTEIADSYLLNNGDAGTGVYDFGGATSFEIPNGATPTVGAVGILALDTTSNNLILATSTAGHIVIGSGTTTLYAFTATTSPVVSGTVMELPSHPLPQVATAIWCKVTSGTSLVINLSDGTNDTNAITCTTTGTQFALTSNNSWTAYERINLEYGTKTGDTGDIVVRVMGYRTSD